MTNVRDIKYGNTKLKIKRFDIKGMAEHATIAMIAKRASGKSYLTREILFHNRHIPTTLVISKTEKLNKFYGNFVPDIYIYNEYNNTILSKIYDRQARLSEDNTRRKQEGKKLKDDRLMLIMDDCMSSKGSWVKEQQILELFFNGRHHHVSFILTMQFALGIPPEMRSNFDYIFLLAEDFITNRKRLYEHYAGMFPTFDVFQQVFSEITQDYGVMVINNRVHSTDITQKVFWYKAKDTPDFTVGNKRYKKFHKSKYNKEWDKRVDIFNPEFLTKKKNKVNFTIEKIK
uniref:Packaging ATPase n=1 Tax=Megaviridae environmental sample TaxID=1737588 RepID=A0A5J6VKK3_9VIRU|nr:MAG: hypothetical protein [Megaviridae environmental sample]